MMSPKTEIALKPWVTSPTNAIRDRPANRSARLVGIVANGCRDLTTAAA